MSRLLEIFGRAITVNTAELIYHWLNTVRSRNRTDNTESLQEQDFDKILELISEKQLDSAEEKLKFYLFEKPSCIFGRMASAAIYLHRNHLKEAIEALSSVYLRQPNNTMALYALGYCYERLGKEAEAREFYQDCLKFKHYLQLPMERLAAMYFKNNEIERTIEEYEQLRDEYPDDISSLVTLGHLYIANLKYNAAIETFNQAILIHPDNFHIQEDEIDILIQAGQLHEAAERLEWLIEQQNNSADSPSGRPFGVLEPVLNVKLGDVLGMLGEDTEAILHYNKAISAQPNFLEAAVKLGTKYLRIEQYTSAAQQFNRAAEINDQIVDAYIGLAIAEELAGRGEDALVTLSLASAIQPNSTLLFAETAILQLKAHHEKDFELQMGAPFDPIETVIEMHRKQLAEYAGNAELNYRYGILMIRVGKISEATQAFRNALGINPTYHRAKSKLALCLYETGNEKLALEQLADIDILSNDILELHYKTAILYCNKGQFQTSVKNLEQLMQNNFAQADAAINIAVVLQNLGLLDRASATWDSLAQTTNQAFSF